jgi:metal-dependent HD superfamily phosphatase/phosphodiesterase
LGGLLRPGLGQKGLEKAVEPLILRGEMVNIEQVKSDPEVVALIESANQQLRVLGYTEHGQRHANLVGSIAQNVLLRLGHPKRVGELAEMAGYLHDIGNVIYREDHSQASALIALGVLSRLGMDYKEISAIMAAIGNHEESIGVPVSEISAALIIADKADVHRSRVQNPDKLAFDIHDRVNYAAQRSFVRVDGEKKTIILEVDVDTEISEVAEYFEIFISRMLLTRKAAQFLGCEFTLVINETKMF